MAAGSDATDGAAVRFPPPLVPLMGLGLGEILHRFVWALPLPLDGAVRYGSAGVLSLCGVALMFAAMGLFRRSGQDPKPWKSTPEILSTGIYARTRNPMYLGMGLLQAGIGLALANGWTVVLVVPVWWVIYRIAIRHEEAYLEQKFGTTYTDYKRSVRRWL
jgi:protein-S-isoprenylcysteine O-methyltransferase Ste14